MKLALLVPDHHVMVRRYFERFITLPEAGATGQVQLIVNPDSGQFDGLVVAQSVVPLSRTFRLVAPPTRTMLVLKEPPDIMQLPDAYTDQFYAVVGQDSRIDAKRLLLTHSAHHWFVEVKAGDADESATWPKPRLISAIVSSKKDTAGHRMRLAFISRLKQHFGEQLEWFGRGVKELGSCKLPGLRDFQYHVVLENSTLPSYWTEKIADSFMANCFPFYWGAPDLHRYFCPDSFQYIDPTDTPRSIAMIEKAIQDNRWASRQADLAQARRLVVTEYHETVQYARHLRSLPYSEPTVVTIRPHAEYSLGLRQRCALRINTVVNRLLAASPIYKPGKGLRRNDHGGCHNVYDYPGDPKS